MKKDDMRTLIVVIIICGLITGLVLLLNRKNNSDKMTIMTSRNMYFAAIDYVNIYLNGILEENGKVVYDILDTKYIEKEKVTVDNVLDKVESYEENALIKARKMYYFETDNAYVIYINGILYKDTYEGLDILDENFEVILTIDNKSSTFSIYPILNDNYKKIVNRIKKINIIENDNNKLKVSQIINEEQICVLYMSDYVDKINNDINSAYQLLTIKMKDIYPSIDSFQSYINSNKDKITTIADKCRVTEGNDNHRTYYVIDGNENQYTFYEEGIMNYTVEYYLK